MNWFDENNGLTYSEACQLLHGTHEERVSLEPKNEWDAYINDTTFDIYALQAYFLMNEYVDKDFKEQGLHDKAINELKYFPKMRDFLALESIVREETKDRLLIRIFLEKYNCNHIYEAVEEFFDGLFKEILINQ